MVCFYVSKTSKLKTPHYINDGLSVTLGLCDIINVLTFPLALYCAVSETHSADCI